MPIFEMPLAELRQYEGRNPKPADFDAYWDRALTEMQNVDPPVAPDLWEQVALGQ